MNRVALAAMSMLLLAGCVSGAQVQAAPMAETRDAVMTQLVACWPEAIRLPAAPKGKLEAVVSVRFGSDGRLAEKPLVVSPKSWPNDPAVRAYIGGILVALANCDAKGFRIPQSYFDLGAPAIQLRFNPMWRRALPPTVTA